MREWFKSKCDEYFGGIERKPALILIGSALLLTIHRYYVKTEFFRRQLASAFVDASLTLLYPYYYWFLGSAITLMALPIAVIKFGIGEKVRDYGFRWKERKLGFSFVGIALCLILPALLLASRTASFQQTYPLCKLAATSWKLLLPYELAYGIYMLSWEFFFRGYMLFGLEERFGNYSILIQTIPFTILHYGKPFTESLGAIFTGILLGVVALRTRSFLYGALLHWLVAMSMDLLVMRIS